MRNISTSCRTFKALFSGQVLGLRRRLTPPVSDNSPVSFRLRTGKGKLKIEHSILDDLRPVLDKLVERDDIRSVIPGVIRPVRDAKGPVRIRITVPTQNGWKAIALANGARQELFISTAMAEKDLNAALQQAIDAAS